MRPFRVLGFTLPIALIATLLVAMVTAGPADAVPAASAGLPGMPRASSSAAGAGPERAFDDDRSTTWTAGAEGESWLELDLGADHVVTSVRAAFASHRKWSFVAEGSADRSTWLPLADRRYGLYGSQFSLDTTGRYRYVRLRITATEGNVPASVRELTIQGMPEANLGIGRTAFADCSLNGFGPQMAIDGDSATHWVGCNNTQPHELTVDLGAARPFTAVEYHAKDQAWLQFVVLGSNDLSAWTELGRHTPQARTPLQRGQVFRFGANATFRYVRLRLTASEFDNWVGAVELQVLGPASQAAERDLALGTSAKASSGYQNQPPANAVDGRTTTAWVADQTAHWQSEHPGEPQWLQVDLGNAANVTRIEHGFVNSSGWTFTLQASADGSSWTTIASGPRTGQTFNHPAAGVYRYVRLTIPGPSTGGHWPNAQSLKVFGNGSPITTKWWADHGPVMRYYPKQYQIPLTTITAGLEDLKRKGYQAIELAPVHEGPRTPFAGLGATNNYAIDPTIGTMADFENLIATAHAKGMKVLIFGNAGYSHPDAPFFRKAEREPGSVERKWFDWKDAPRGASDCVADERGVGWFYSATAGKCFWVQWTSEGVNLPAYNFGTQEWREENVRILEFWLDKGVDGYGADAPRVYRNITDAISDRYITDVLNAYDIWALPEGLQPDELLVGIPQLHYNVIHDLSITHWGGLIPGFGHSRIIPAIDSGNPSALETAFKQSRDEVNQQGGSTLTAPSWELDGHLGTKVPADKRLLEIATLNTMGTQFFLHYGYHLYLPHVEAIPTWTAQQQADLDAITRAPTATAALQARGLRVRAHTNDDSRFYAYKRTSKNGGVTSLVVMNYQNSRQEITVNLTGLGIAMDQTPLDLVTGQPAPAITDPSYKITLDPRRYAILDVAQAPAPTALPNGVYRVRAEVSSATSALDVRDCQTQNGADVRIWDWIPGSPCQDWQVTKVAEPDVYTIADRNTGQVLDVAGCSTADGTAVNLWPYAGRNCQQWRIIPLGDKAWKVVGVGSGKALDVAGCNPANDADLIIYPFHGAQCQRWRFELQ